VGLSGFSKVLLAQPTGLVRINPKHWLAKDLIFAHTGHQAFVFGRPVAAIADPLLRASGPFGLQNPALNNTAQWVPNGANATDYTLGAAGTPLPITLAVWYSSNYDNILTPLLSIRRTLGSNGGLRVAKGVNGFTTQGTSYSTTGSFASATSNNFVNSASEWVQGAAVFVSNTSRTSYLSAVGGSVNTTSNVYPSDCNVISIGRTPVAANTVATTNVYQIALPLIIGRELDPDEVKQLYLEQRSNPWVMFAKKPVWVPMAGGAIVNPTLTAAQAFNVTTSSAQARVTFTRP
jgi:hypothetical protein